MTKGTTRRERKYRKKAVSVCKITSTSNQNANANNNNTNSTGNNHERGLLIPNTLTPPITTGTPSSQINNNNNNNNLFSSPQLQINKVIIYFCFSNDFILKNFVLDNFRFYTYSNNSSGIYCNTFSSIST